MERKKERRKKETKKKKNRKKEKGENGTEEFQMVSAIESPGQAKK